MIERLPKEFKGKGDVKNYYYSQVYQRKLKNGKYAYIYSQMDISVEEPYICGYEVVIPQVSPKVEISSENNHILYKKTDILSEYYPNSERWGTNGFTFLTLNEAMKKISSFA